MRRAGRSYVRQMPRIYGSLQEPERTSPLRTIGVFFRFFVLLALISAAGWALFFSPWFQVTDVEVDGAAFVSADSVRAQVPLGGNIWRLQAKTIEAKVLTNPVVESVEVLRGIPHTVRVVVHERPPMALWTSGSTVSVLDPQGIAFEQFPMTGLPAATTPLGAALAKNPRVVDTKSLPVAADQTVVSPVFIGFIQQCQTQLAALLPQLTIDHYEVANTTYDLTLVTKQGMTVTFNTLADPGVQVRNLTRLVKEKNVPLTAKVNLSIDRWAYVQQ